MNNREITQIVKTNRLSKAQLICKDQMLFCCHFREPSTKLYETHNAKARFINLLPN